MPNDWLPTVLHFRVAGIMFASRLRPATPTAGTLFELGTGIDFQYIVRGAVLAAAVFSMS
jgi:ABC-type xylose transport system permease subunit